jgi:murein hydrolase activator
MKSVALIVAVFLVTHAESGYAEPVAVPKSQELSQIQLRLKAANETIEQIKIKREKLIAQLKNIEKQYGATAGSLHDLGLQIGGKQQRLKSLSKEMRKRQVELSLQSSELSKQVKASFVMGKKEQLRLLLNQQDPALASRMMVYYNYLNKSRLKKLADLKSNMAALAKLEQEKHRETELLGQTIHSHQTVQVGLNTAQKQREQLLVKLNNEFKEKSRQLGQLEDSTAESQALIEQLQRAALAREQLDAQQPSNHADPLDIDGNPIILPQQEQAAAFDVGVGKAFAELKGQLPWPVKGSIIKEFGSQRSETRWDGVLIAAKEGSDIRAVTAGRVVFADWLRGYGLLIIIDHGHGYMTLYAFNQSLYKKVGEPVKAGTVIGAVGKSGGREEAGLYFGIRSKGKPVNPAIWCKKG